MQVLLLILAIGVLNLCLGYAAAVHLGYGPPTLRDAWMTLSAMTRVRDLLDGVGRPASVPLPQLEAIPGLEPDPIAHPEKAPDAVDSWRPAGADDADDVDVSEDAVSPSQSAALDSMPPTNAEYGSDPVPVKALG